MYESHWGLQSRPFDSCTGDSFYFAGESYQGALLKLRYAIEQRRGAALLCGGSGLGKTMLSQTLLAQLPEEFAPRVSLVFPDLPPEDLLAVLLLELEAAAPSGRPTKGESVRAIGRCLIENAREGRHAVVVIDEAQLLCRRESLETLRLLTNFELDGKPALTLLLSAQTSLLPVLERMPSLEERLAVKCLLRPLTAEETAQYIRHRLQIAGAAREIFLPNALEAAHYFSEGTPRRINRLCDLALLIGFAEEQDAIAAPQVEAVSRELVGAAAD